MIFKTLAPPVITNSLPTTAKVLPLAVLPLKAPELMIEPLIFVMLITLSNMGRPFGAAVQERVVTPPDDAMETRGGALGTPK